MVAVDDGGLDQIELLSRGVEAVNQDRVGLGDLQRACGHGRQHIVEVERGDHGAADLFENFQFVDRLRKIARAFRHLVFKSSIGLAQLACHAVELVGKFFEFIAGLDGDAAAEVAGAKPPCARAQRADWDHHAPRQQHAGERCHGQSEGDQQSDAEKQIADRRQGLPRRLLEHHEPAEARHWFCRGENGLAVESGAVIDGCATGFHQRRDLRQG